MQPADPSVNFDGLKPCVLRAFSVVEVARKKALGKTKEKEATITSAVDGIHSNNSLHYAGLAFDLRTNDYRWVLCEELREALGAGWDIVDEGDHIHIERDPKKRPLTAEEAGDA